MNGVQGRLAVAGGRIGVRRPSSVACSTRCRWAAPHPRPAAAAPLQGRQPLAYRWLGLEGLGDRAQVMRQTPQRPFPLHFGQAP